MNNHTEYLINSSISFTAIFGDEGKEIKLRSYLLSLEKILADKMPAAKYSKHLDFILIDLRVDGFLKWFTIPDKPKLMNYSSKNRDISYQVSIKKDFWLLSSKNKQEYLLNIAKDAINATCARLKKKKFDVDLVGMMNDFDEVAREYRSITS
ncbi:hypothetical protein [Massilia genomosp. 1]|uniref:Immunity protein 63 domain-containing protein n=1 Tax=Massilia genomosp. 1 TaxID=2609280 RepID=A0ABX0N290_9BURK|nr:hypothetical protein [Massilia genomosp. 1]NHZ67120.1 hypothetical protein [Massilia genomosp. 1]